MCLPFPLALGLAYAFGLVAELRLELEFKFDLDSVLRDEYFPHRQRLEYGIFPRISAISEVYWSLPSVRNLDYFVERLQKQYARYDLWGANYYAGNRIR